MPIEDVAGTVKDLIKEGKVLHFGLSAWVEKGISPASTTKYGQKDGQAVIPATAKQRKGIQPVVNAKVNGSKSATIKAGRAVNFKASIDVPKGAGKLIAAAWNMEGLPDPFEKTPDWDFENSDAFPVKAKWTTAGKNAEIISVNTTYTFKKPGIYFLTIRVASERNGNAGTPYTRIQNLDHVQVEVKS